MGIEPSKNTCITEIKGNKKSQKRGGVGGGRGPDEARELITWQVLRRNGHSNLPSPGQVSRQRRADVHPLYLYACIGGLSPCWGATWIG